MAHRKKNFIKQRAIEQSKQIALKYTSDEPIDKLHPAFCFRYLVGKYGFPQSGDRAKRNAIINTIQKLSQKCWGDLKRSSSRQIGYHAINELKGKSPIPLAKDSEIISFDCGNGRMIGYRDAKIFYVFWFDFNFSLYRHN